MQLPKFQFSKKLKGSTVLLRLDLNVPIERRQILDDARIVAALPTIKKLVERGAKIVIIAHLGRPGGKKDMKYTLAPVAARLEELLGQSIKFIDARTIQGMKRSVKALKPGKVAMLENIRFHKAEVQNEAWFAESLASLGDVFVFDGFGVAHRDTPSVTGISRHLPSYAGYLVQTELAAFDTLRGTRKETTLGIVGGVKIKTKLPVIEHLLETCDKVLVGGAIVNTFLKAKGYTVGGSIVDEQLEFAAIQSMKRRAVITPIDVIVGTPDGTQYRVVDITKHDKLLALPDEQILDIGPKTIQKYSVHIKASKAIVWNGTMGYFEQSPYHIGTAAIARLVASLGGERAYVIIGGGETVAAMHQTGMLEHVDHVSTGGGAMLRYIVEGTTPAFEALVKGK